MPTEDLEPEPWEQQKNEQARSFFNFTVFRDIGGYRTIEKAHDKIEAIVRECQDNEEKGEVQGDVPKVPSLSALTKASSRWNWVERCKAWDAHLDEVVRTEQELETKAMVKRHAEDSKLFQEKVKDLLDEADNVEKPTSKVWLLNSIVNTYNAAAGLERASRGEPEPEENDKRSGLKELGEIFDTSFPEDDEAEGPDEEEAEETRIPVETCPEEREEVYSGEHGQD